jgi:hypothetical protein
MEIHPRKLGDRSVYEAKRLVCVLALRVPFNAKFEDEYLVLRNIPNAAIVRRWTEQPGRQPVVIFPKGEIFRVISKSKFLLRAWSIIPNITARISPLD